MLLSGGSDQTSFGKQAGQSVTISQQQRERSSVNWRLRVKVWCWRREVINVDYQRKQALVNKEEGKKQRGSWTLNLTHV